MAAPGSPAYSNGYEEDPIFAKSHYTQDISEQMRVPKRIRATGEYYDDFDFPMNNGTQNHWNYNDKIDMTVPDRIMVIGSEQHLGIYCEFIFVFFLWKIYMVLCNTYNVSHLAQSHDTNEKCQTVIFFPSIISGTRTAPREIILDNSIINPQQDNNPVRVSTPPRVITLSEHRFPTAAEDQYTPDEEHSQPHEYDRSSVGSIEDKRMAVTKPKKLFTNEFFNTR